MSNSRCIWRVATCPHELCVNSFFVLAMLYFLLVLSGCADFDFRFLSAFFRAFFSACFSNVIHTNAQIHPVVNL